MDRQGAVVAAMLAALVLGGCAGPTSLPGPVEGPATGPAPSGFEEPVLALSDCSPLFQPACFEPVVAVDPAGRIFLATVDGAAIAVSTDGGATFGVIPAPPFPPGAPPSARRGDGTVQVDPEGSLFYSALLSSPTADGAAAVYLFGTQVSRSDDGGSTWAASTYVPTAGGDRQWLAFGEGGRVYLAFWQIPTGLWLFRSDDRGATFATLSPSSPTGPNGLPGPSGPPAVLPDGRLVVPHARADGVHVAVSDDGGMTFTDRLVSSSRPVDWPSAAVDASGGLAVAWPDGAGSVLVATSTTGGESWTEPVEWGAGFLPGAAAWLANAGGRLALAWFADGGELRFAAGPPQGPPDTASLVATGLDGAPTSDFAHMATMPGGRAVVAYADAQGAFIRIQASG